MSNTNESKAPKIPGRLAKTSRGSSHQFPPEAYIRDELKEFGSIDTGRKWHLNLKGEIHPLFAWDRFEKYFTRQEYIALEQSLLLASRLLEVALPYISCFLPKAKMLVYEQTIESPTYNNGRCGTHGADQLRELQAKDRESYQVLRPAWSDLKGQYEDYNYEDCEGYQLEPSGRDMETKARVAVDHLPIKPQMLKDARQELRDIAKSVEWTKDSDMLPKHSIWGSNTPGIFDKAEFPWTDVTQISGDEWTEYLVYDASGEVYSPQQPRREITIAIASQHLKAIMSSRENSGQRLSAVFGASVTILHELGYTIWLQNPRHQEEFEWVGGDVAGDLGQSFIAWLFCGWYPESIDLGDPEDHHTFKNGQEWHKQYKIGQPHPIARVCYSIPLEHIQSILSQDQWDRYNIRKDSEIIRKQLLSPQTPFVSGKHARRGKPMYPKLWDNDYRFRGYVCNASSQSDFSTWHDPDWIGDPSELSSSPPKRKFSDGATIDLTRDEDRLALPPSYDHYDVDTLLLQMSKLEEAEENAENFHHYKLLTKTLKLLVQERLSPKKSNAKSSGEPNIGIDKKSAFGGIPVQSPGKPVAPTSREVSAGPSKVRKIREDEDLSEPPSKKLRKTAGSSVAIQDDESESKGEPSIVDLTDPKGLKPGPNKGKSTRSLSSVEIVKVGTKSDSTGTRRAKTRRQLASNTGRSSSVEVVEERVTNTNKKRKKQTLGRKAPLDRESRSASVEEVKTEEIGRM